jgi:hypothetical protein
MTDKMTNKIKEKVLSYYREIKDRQIELENRYYNYVKNKSYSQIKQMDIILIFWSCIVMSCILQILFVNVWKASNEWTRLEKLTIFYVYCKVGFHMSDYMTEYLFNITKKKEEEEKMSKAGATKENPIDLTNDDEVEQIDTPASAMDKSEEKEEEKEKEEEEEEEESEEEEEPEEILNKLNEEGEIVYEIEI